MVKNSLLGAEIQSSKKIQKSTLEPHYICFRKETARKNNLCSKNYTTLKSGKDFALPYSLAKAIITRQRGQKCTLLVADWKLQKHAKNDSRTAIELFYGEKALKEHLIFEEWQHFEKWQNWLQPNLHYPDSKGQGWMVRIIESPDNRKYEYEIPRIKLNNLEKRKWNLTQQQSKSKLSKMRCTLVMMRVSSKLVQVCSLKRNKFIPHQNFIT